MTRNYPYYFPLIFILSCSTPQTDSSSGVDALQSKASVNTTDSSYKGLRTEVTVNEKTALDFLNDPSDFSFTTEDSLIGIGIVTLSDSVDSYNKKLFVYDDNGKNIGYIEHRETEIICFFHGKKELESDSISVFSPRLFSTNPDYYRLAFDCIGFDRNFFNVVINRKTGQTGKIKKNDPLITFENLETFVDSWTGIRLDFDRHDNPIHESPTEGSKILNHAKETRYRIWYAEKLSMKGDWLEIEIEETAEKGWIKWRTGKRINIRMYYSC